MACPVCCLSFHYYGNKDAIHELDQITAMPYLVQSLFGYGELPPFWCLHEWKAAAGFAVACKHRPALLWSLQAWTATSLPPPNECTSPRMLYWRRRRASLMAYMQCLRTNNPRGCPLVVKWYTSTAQG